LKAQNDALTAAAATRTADLAAAAAAIEHLTTRSQLAIDKIARLKAHTRATSSSSSSSSSSSAASMLPPSVAVAAPAAQTQPMTFLSYSAPGATQGGGGSGGGGVGGGVGGSGGVTTVTTVNRNSVAPKQRHSESRSLAVLQKQLDQVHSITLSLLSIITCILLLKLITLYAFLSSFRTLPGDTGAVGTARFVGREAE
jgi:hypothetical protein